jgi:hypothetical protein
VRQLGGVVVAVTVLSILGAIVTLPAALMLVPSPFQEGMWIELNVDRIDRIWICILKLYLEVDRMWISSKDIRF